MNRRTFLSSLPVSAASASSAVTSWRGNCAHPRPVEAFLADGTTPESGELSKAIATKEESSSEVRLSNSLVRIRFHPGKPKFEVFPEGYTGFTIDLKDGQQWLPMATAPYFSAFVYRSHLWGRDWLAYVIPKDVQFRNEENAATIIFSAQPMDLDRVTWHFTFTFTLRSGEPTVDVVYTANADQRRDLLLFWGPRLHVGEGTFGATKDEALFPGLEYLGSKERSSNIWALAPDAKLNFVPHPAKITIPLMTVLSHGRAVGILWDPTQKWNGVDTTPSAVFASPNWIENQQNHLLGLFLPSIPQYVSENGLRAHRPATIDPRQEVSLQCQLFTLVGRHAVDAVDAYLKTRGGLPPLSSKPIEYKTALEMLVQVLTTTAWDAEKKGWLDQIMMGHGSTEVSNVHSNPRTVVSLATAAPLLADLGMAKRAHAVVREALSVKAERPLLLALRTGGVAAALNKERSYAIERVRKQQADGSWVYVPSVEGEEGLAALQAPPEPGTIGYAGQRDEGLTAGQVASLLEYVLVSADEEVLQAALRGIQHLDRYVIPFGYSIEMGQECPHSPCLHGTYFALRSYLLAYRITRDRRFLERAVYWAKTGLPFLYLWSLPPREVRHGQIAMNTSLQGNQLYRDTRRAPMLYGAMYGYGSSQFDFAWYGFLVHWIGLVYARDLLALAQYDNTQPWKHIAEGILISALWLTYDQPPYRGYFPDAFNLEDWVPSGPAISPGPILETLLAVHYARPIDPRTAILREGAARYHLTSAAAIGDPKLAGTRITFTLKDPTWSHCRVVLAGAHGVSVVMVDGKELPIVRDLEQADECWHTEARGQVLIKVKEIGRPRRIAAQLRQQV